MTSNKTENSATLWIISELYYPEETSTGYYMTRIAEGLVDDFRVKAICGQPTYSKHGTRAPKHEIHKGVEIFRAAGTTLNKNVILLRIVNMVTLGISVFLKALKHFAKGDRVLVVTTPPSMPFVIALASLIRGAAYYLLIHDTYPELLVAVGKTKPDSLFARTAHFANRWLYKHASKIIVVGRDMAELTAAKVTNLEIPILTIPNWAELETVSPAPRETNELLNELGLQDKIVFLYAGNMGHPNDMESIVECAARPDIDPRVHFIFLGAGAKRKWLEDTAAKLDSQNITILDPRPRTDQQIFLNACDVAIISLVPGMKGVSMPSRTYNALAAGKPILAIVEKGSEAARVVTEDNIGWVTEPDRPRELFAMIESIVKNSDLLGGMGKRSREVAIAKYSVDTALEQYRKALL